MTEYTRSELAVLAINDAWDNMVRELEDGFVVHFVDREFIANLDDTIYAPFGVIPPQLDDESDQINVGFCLDIIVEQTKDMTEEDFVKYILYWNMRLRMRFILMMDLELAQDGECLTDDLLLEDMVESAMITHGMPRWWKDLLA